MRRPGAVPPWPPTNFGAPPDIVLHPGRQAEVIGIPLHLARVERQRGDEVGEVGRAHLEHEVGRWSSRPRIPSR
jgi:hypothetical protein